MVLFIPWRVVAEESGAAHFGFGGAMLPDLLGPMVRPPAAPSISTLVIFRFGATMELGRSGRPMMRPLLRPLWSYGVDAANTLDRKPRCPVFPVDHIRCGHVRARGWAARCCSTCSGRLGGAAAAGRTMVRSPAAPSPIPF
jgi:hypothetical protein